jgi:hypothetical protein
MGFTRLQLKVAQRFLEALFPCEEREIREAMEEFPARLQEYWDFRRFDHPVYPKVVPLLFTLINLAPIFLLFYLWKPLPFIWLPRKDRIRFLEKMERSRIYGVRGLFVAIKLIVCMVFFEDPRTFAITRYDGRGMNPAISQMGMVSL